MVCVSWVGRGREVRYVHLYEHTMNNSPQNCTFITVSHIFHLMVTGWVSRSRCSERIWGAKCFSGINPCKGQGKKADLGREELNCEEGLAKPQSDSRESGAHIARSGDHQELRQQGLCSFTLLAYQNEATQEGITPKRPLCSWADPQGAQPPQQAPRLSLKKVWVVDLLVSHTHFYTRVEVSSLL